MPTKIRQGGAAKFVRRTAAATEDYTAGVMDPRTDWAQATAASEATYNEGVQQAITRKAFAKGVQKTGTARWKEKALTKGADRFRPGVEAAGDDYAAGVAPYLETIANTSLPPRYPKGDPRNLDRVKAITTALRNKKTGQSGRG